ncbi:MAG: ferritin-like domain-containing protein [Myxococcaceae bacterium]|nr:ferritin-like domain-containing protein [Myxococcaceae bacterium]
MTTTLIAVAGNALKTGAPDVEHLYELSKRRQWNASDLPWASLDFSAVPLELRRGFADLLAQTHHGELGALTASARLVQSDARLMDKLFGATQVADEARHVEWFSRLLFQLDAPAPVMPALAAFIDDVTQAGDDLHLLVGMNILIEGLAQTLMLHAGKLLGALEVPELESFKVVGTWLTERVAADESRHLAFGIGRVRALVETLDTTKRLQLEERVAQWSTQLMQLTREHSAGVAAFGLDGDELMARCLADTHSRLKLTGIESGQLTS